MDAQQSPSVPEAARADPTRGHQVTPVRRVSSERLQVTEAQAICNSHRSTMRHFAVEARIGSLERQNVTISFDTGDYVSGNGYWIGVEFDPSAWFMVK